MISAGELPKFGGLRRSLGNDPESRLLSIQQEQRANEIADQRAYAVGVRDENREHIAKLKADEMKYEEAKATKLQGYEEKISQVDYARKASLAAIASGQPVPPESCL